MQWEDPPYLCESVLPSRQLWCAPSSRRSGGKMGCGEEVSRLLDICTWMDLTSKTWRGST